MNLAGADPQCLPSTTACSEGIRAIYFIQRHRKARRKLLQSQGRSSALMGGLMFQVPDRLLWLLFRCPLFQRHCHLRMLYQALAPQLPLLDRWASHSGWPCLLPASDRSTFAGCTGPELGTEAVYSACMSSAGVGEKGQLCHKFVTVKGPSGWHSKFNEATDQYAAPVQQAQMPA